MSPPLPSLPSSLPRNRHHPRLSRALSRCALITGLLLICSALGCVKDNKGKRSIGPPPSNPKLSAMFMAAQTPRDSNSNGYLDTCLITVYIFPENYPRAMQVVGTFDITLLAKGGKILRTWSLPCPGTSITAVNAGVGPGYVIKLSLLDPPGPGSPPAGSSTQPTASDVMPTQSVDVTLRFTDAAGQTVSAEPTTLLLGRAS